jgi:hypothetical protein
MSTAAKQRAHSLPSGMSRDSDGDGIGIEMRIDTHPPRYPLYEAARLSPIEAFSAIGSEKRKRSHTGSPPASTNAASNSSRCHSPRFAVAPTVSHHTVVVCYPAQPQARHGSGERFSNSVTRQRITHLRSFVRQDLVGTEPYRSHPRLRRRRPTGRTSPLPAPARPTTDPASARQRHGGRRRRRSRIGPE